jgi:uncharacterized protein
MTFLHFSAYNIKMERARKNALIRDLDTKVVLLSGPRQVGKTYLSKKLFSNFVYLNFDSQADRKIIREMSWPRDVDLVIFDELHKMKKWKSWIKGIYDTEGVRPRLLVTGSARMDTFKKGGDSLAGRHFLHRLHPFTVAELKAEIAPSASTERILKCGGFPEPFLSNDVEFAKRWRGIHHEKIIREDLLDLENVRQLKQFEILTDLLSERVGSPVSFNSLARDLEVSPHTVKKWISILESLFVVFIVPPYSKNIARSILKEPKIFFFDTGRVSNGDAAKIENIVATALLSKINAGADLRGEKGNLYYVRDKEKREVDFLTVIDKKNIDLVEVKLSDDQISKSLLGFQKVLSAKSAVQVVYTLKKEMQFGDVKVRDLAGWLGEQS